MDRREHWEQIYARQAPEEVSWYEPRPESSLALIARAHPTTDARIIDVGGGASLLADCLLDGGYRHVTVLDVSGQALSASKARLGARANRINWIVGDVTAVALPSHAFDVWHDRAAFHFLTNATERARYITQASLALAPGGGLVIATFAEDGPTRCSGLDVMRYSPEALAEELAPHFTLEESHYETHRTPSGIQQRFVHCLFRRVAD